MKSEYRGCTIKIGDNGLAKYDGQNQCVVWENLTYNKFGGIIQGENPLCGDCGSQAEDRGKHEMCPKCSAYEFAVESSKYDEYCCDAAEQLAELKQRLKEIEWEGYSSVGACTCPACDGEQSGGGHENNCWLKRSIGE